MDIQSKIRHWLSQYSEQAGVDDIKWLHQITRGDFEAQPDENTELALKALKNLELLSPDPATVAATLLFSMPVGEEDSSTLACKQRPEVATLTAQLRRLDYFGRTYLSSDQDRAEGLRRLLLALIADVRVALILLAWQLARLQVARRWESEKREAVAHETRLIHAPLANRLGIWQLKWALEDLSFQYLEPKAYQRIRRLVAEQRQEREVFIDRFMADLQSKLKQQNIDAEVTGRAKHLYSIWKKMQRKGLDFHELFDVRAVRVLVSSLPECYSALGLVHTHWTPVPGEFDDYISKPKANLYQSLHTAVVGAGGRVIEVQIRTHEMHHHAELGVAAHWRYKEGGPRDQNLEKRIGMMRQLFDGGEQDDQAILDEFENITSEDRVYVLTPTGEVKDLVSGATPLDFAYLVHTEVGHRCRGARVNGRIVPLTTTLENGDRVEILTAKEARPSRDWMLPRMGYIRSARARAKVRQWFKQANHDENLQAGRQAIEVELKRVDLDVADVALVVQNFNFHTAEELYVAVGSGDLTASQVARAIERKQAANGRSALGLPIRSVQVPSKQKDDVQIEGIGNLLHQLARCCQPVPGDEIAGYVTRGRGVSIHRSDCRQFLNLQRQQPDRILSVRWRNQAADRYPVHLIVEAWDRSGLIKDIGMVLATENANISSLQGQAQEEPEAVRIDLTVQVTDFDQLSNLVSRLQGIEGVLSARRLR